MFCIFLYSFLFGSLFSVVCSVLCGWIWNIRVLLTELRSYHPCPTTGNKSCNNAWRLTLTLPPGLHCAAPRSCAAHHSPSPCRSTQQTEELAQKAGGAWSSIVIHGKPQHATSTSRQGIYLGRMEHPTSTSRQGIYWGCKEHTTSTSRQGCHKHATSTSRQGIYWGCHEHATTTSRQGIYWGCQEHATSTSRQGIYLGCAAHATSTSH